MIPTLIIFLPHTHFIAFLCHRIASQQAAPAILLLYISALVEAKKIDARIALRNTLIVADFNRKRKYGKSRVLRFSDIHLTLNSSMIPLSS